MVLPNQTSRSLGISSALSDMAAGDSQEGNRNNRLISECLTSSSELHGCGIAPREKAIALLELGSEMRQDNSIQMARRYLEKGAEILDELYGDSGHPLLADALHQLADVVFSDRDLEVASALYQTSFNMKQQLFGDTVNHLQLASMLMSCTRIAALQRDLPKALELYEELINYQEENMDGVFENHDTLNLLFEMGSLALEEDHLEQAENIFKECFDMSIRIFGSMMASPFMGDLLHHQARVSQLQNQLEPAYLTYKACLCIKQIAYAGGDESSVAKTLLETGRVAHEMEDLENARQHYGDCIAMVTRLSIETGEIESIDLLATTLHEYGRLMIGMDLLEIAEQYFIRSTDTAVRALGEEASLFLVAANFHNLGFTNFKRGRFEEAQEKLNKSLSLRRRLFKGDVNLDLEETIFCFADLEVQMKSYLQAKRHFKEGMDMRKRLAELGIVSKQSVADAYHKIGLAYIQMKEMKTASKLFKKAIIVKTKTQTEPDDSLLNWMLELAEMNAQLCKFDTAERIFMQSLDTANELSQDSESEVIAEIHQQIGAVALAKGHFDRAQKMTSKSVSMWQRIASDGDRAELAEALYQLGRVFNATGNLPEAKRVLQESLEMSRRIYEVDGVETLFAQTICELGVLARKQEKWGSSLALFEKCEDILDRLRGDARYAEMVPLYEEMGKHALESFDIEYAETYFKKCMRYSRRLFGVNADRPAIARSVIALGRVALMNGEMSLAQMRFDEGARMLQRIHGKSNVDHPDLLDAYSGLAKIARSNGDANEAEGFEKKATSMRNRLFHVSEDKPELLSFGRIAALAIAVVAMRFALTRKH